MTSSQALIVSSTAKPGAWSGLSPSGLALPGSEFQELEDVERFAGCWGEGIYSSTVRVIGDLSFGMLKDIQYACMNSNSQWSNRNFLFSIYLIWSNQEPVD